MKKLIALLLMLALVLSLAACGTTAKTEEPAKEETAAPAEAQTEETAAEQPAEETTAAEATESTEPAAASGDVEIGMFDPNYDYSQNPTYKIAYYVLSTGVLYEGLSVYYQHWCDRLNVEYGGIIAANGDKDAYLSNLTTLAADYDGLLLDADATQYNRVAEIMEETGTPWMVCMAAPRDYGQEGNPLLHPYVGYDNYVVGTMMPEYLLNMAADLWPDVDTSEMAFICVDHTVSPPLHQREEGCHDTLVATDPSWEDRYFVADTSIASFDVDTSSQVVAAILAENSQYEYWLVFGEIDDMAMGAALSLDNVGLTDTSAVVTFGGTGAVNQWDAGMYDAWRAALYATYPVYSEPIICGLYAMVNGEVTAEELWPEWIDENDPGYAKRLLPAYWINPDNYQSVIKWGDIYGGFDDHLDYPAEGITRDSYSTYVAVPDSYKK